MIPYYEEIDWLVPVGQEPATRLSQGKKRHLWEAQTLQGHDLLQKAGSWLVCSVVC